jgi:hypothetical protein
MRHAEKSLKRSELDTYPNCFPAGTLVVAQVADDHVILRSWRVAIQLRQNVVRARTPASSPRAIIPKHLFPLSRTQRDARLAQVAPRNGIDYLDP